MRTTITIDDTLFGKATAIAGDENASSLITKALEMLVAAESKKRILRLSGGSPGFTIPGRDSRSADMGMVAESPADYKK